MILKINTFDCYSSFLKKIKKKGCLLITLSIKKGNKGCLLTTSSSVLINRLLKIFKLFIIKHFIHSCSKTRVEQTLNSR